MKRILPTLATAALVVSTGFSAPIIRTLSEAAALSVDDLIETIKFDLTGTALSRSGDGETPENWFFFDNTGGTEIYSEYTDRIDIRPGDRIRLRGTLTQTHDNIIAFKVAKSEVLGHAPLQTTMASTGSDISSGALNYRIVRIRGVIATATVDEIDSRYITLSLRTSTSPVFIGCLGSENIGFFQNLIDAEVEIKGHVAPITGWRRNLGSIIRIADTNAVRLITAPPSDPFKAEMLTDTGRPHRQRADGTVIATGIGRFFLRTRVGRMLGIRPVSHANLPAAGDNVTVVGFAAMDPFRLELSEALFRTEKSHEAIDESVEEFVDYDLFTATNGHERINTKFNGRIVRLRGTVRSIQGETGILQLECGSHVILIEPSAAIAHLRNSIPDGCTADITGLCLAEFEQSTHPMRFPAFKHFTIIPRTAADIRIVAQPPWWTPLRLLLLASILATILLVSAIWNITLKQKSERRGKELYEEKIGHALAEQKVEERTRLAVELHDSVSQTLTGVALQLDGGEVETAKAMLASCRGELRRCLWDLRSRTFEEKDMTEAVTRTITPHLNGVDATVRFNVPRERLSESLTHAILRIIRELVINAIRHGQAKHIRIAGEMHENTVSFSVTDDGCGFAPETAPGPEQGHFGLLGIRERIEDFNGTLKIASAPEKGAKFTVTLLATDETNEQ